MRLVLMTKNYLIVLLGFLGLSMSPHQKVKCQERTFVIETGEHAWLSIPLKLSLVDYPISNDSLIVNVWRQGNDQEILLKSQLESTDPPTLWIVPDKVIPANSKVTFKLSLKKGHAAKGQNRVAMDNNNILLGFDEIPILNYRHAFFPAPDSVNPIFGKSGFIHPLYSPKGNILTTIPTRRSLSSLRYLESMDESASGRSGN